MLCSKQNITETKHSLFTTVHSQDAASVHQSEIMVKNSISKANLQNTLNFTMLTL